MERAQFNFASTVPEPPPLPAGFGIEAMLDAAQAASDTHALVIGPFALDLMCGLIRRGCAAAAELPFEGRQPTERADVILVPHVRCVDEADRAILVARRTLLPCGRIVLQATTGMLEAAISRRLLSAGFSAIRSRPHKDGTIIAADWPMFGLGREASHA